MALTMPAERSASFVVTTTSITKTLSARFTASLRRSWSSARPRGSTVRCGFGPVIARAGHAGACARRLSSRDAEARHGLEPRLATRRAQDRVRLDDLHLALDLGDAAVRRERPGIDVVGDDLPVARIDQELGRRRVEGRREQRIGQDREAEEQRPCRRRAPCAATGCARGRRARPSCPARRGPGALGRHRRHGCQPGSDERCSGRCCVHGRSPSSRSRFSPRAGTRPHCKSRAGSWQGVKTANAP